MGSFLGGPGMGEKPASVHCDALLEMKDRFIDCLSWVCGFWIGGELGTVFGGTLNEPERRADSETMERLQAQHQLRMACISFAMAVLFGYGAAQSAPISDGVAQPPLGGQLEGLTAHATRLLQQHYGYCITDRLRFSLPCLPRLGLTPIGHKGLKLAVLCRSYEDRLPFVRVYWVIDLHCMQRYVLHWCGWYLAPFEVLIFQNTVNGVDHLKTSPLACVSSLKLI